MKKGDILLVKTKKHPLRWLYRLIFKSNYDHIGWILDQTALIEVNVWGKVKPVSIRKYTDNSNYEVKLLRIRNIKYELLKKLVDKATLSDGILFSGASLIAETLAEKDIYFRRDRQPEYIRIKDIETSRRTKNVTCKLWDSGMCI